MGVPAILLVTSHAPSKPPLAWVPLAALAAVVLCTWHVGARSARWLCLLAALLGVAAAHLLLTAGFVRGHDTIVHLWGAYALYQQVHAGDLFPLWLHHVGLGQPVMLFYPPVGYYSMLPFFALGEPTFRALDDAFVLWSALSGVSMFCAARRFTGDARAALVAAVAYCFAPYVMMQSHYRVAVAESASMVVLPWFFARVQSACDEPSRRNLILAGCACGLLAITHPLSLLMAGTAAVIWQLAGRAREGARAAALSLQRLVLVAAIGVSLAGFYVLPLLAEQRYASVDAALMEGTRTLYSLEGLTPTDLLQRRLWNKRLNNNIGALDANDAADVVTASAPRERMPFYFGISLLLLAALGATAQRPRPPRGLLTATLVCLALTLRPLDLWLARVPPFAVLQFPWRFLSLATFGASLLAGFALPRLEQLFPGERVRRILPTALVALLLFDFAPYGGAPYWQKPYRGLYGVRGAAAVAPPPMRVVGLRFPPSDPRVDTSNLWRVYPEYFSRAAGALVLDHTTELPLLQHVSVARAYGRSYPNGELDIAARPYAELMPHGRHEWLALPFERRAETIRVQLTGRAGRLVIKEMWFPGWVAELGARHFEPRATHGGLIEIDVRAEDRGELVLRFSRLRWDRLAGCVLSVLCALALVLAWRRWPSDRATPPAA
ncbi:MAG TPA: 6-pyruvoyl-tetrahydropterin synthase-related protein [Polyangiales bacterium]|nr:6-pyruvoyl-tetrahydropterin synthase-related protein [Polyangiales bacterium]